VDLGPTYTGLDTCWSAPEEVAIQTRIVLDTAGYSTFLLAQHRASCKLSRLSART